MSKPSKQRRWPADNSPCLEFPIAGTNIPGTVGSLQMTKTPVLFDRTGVFIVGAFEKSHRKRRRDLRVDRPKAPPVDYMSVQTIRLVDDYGLTNLHRPI